MFLLWRLFKDPKLAHRFVVYVTPQAIPDLELGEEGRGRLPAFRELKVAAERSPHLGASTRAARRRDRSRAGAHGGLCSLFAVQAHVYSSAPTVDSYFFTR